MRVSLRRLLILIALLGLLAGGWFLASLRSSRSREARHPDAVPVAEHPPTWYVALIETNRDTFPNRLFLESTGPSPRPFRFEETAVVVAEGVDAAIARGTQEEEFRLVLDRPGLDPATQARVFLVYEVRYAGAGREDGVADYYLFSAFPAQVTLPAFDASSGTLHLTLDDAMGQTFAVRLFPDRTLVLRESPTGGLALVFAGQTLELPPGDTHLMAPLAATLTVTQELFAPVPKGPVSQDAFRTVTDDYGPIEFSTELSVTSQAVTEVRAE